MVAILSPPECVKETTSPRILLSTKRVNSRWTLHNEAEKVINHFVWHNIHLKFIWISHSEPWRHQKYCVKSQEMPPFMCWKFFWRKIHLHQHFLSFLGTEMQQVKFFLMEINKLSLRQDGRHFPDDIFEWIFLNENLCISIKVSLKFDPKCPISNIPALVQIMAWRRTGDKPLFEPMVNWFLMHICITRPQWVKNLFIPHSQ